jgi:hypothetical protein
MFSVRNACFAVAIGLTSAAAHAMPVNLLANGDFEANIGNVASGGYTVVNAGSSLITGWTVGSTSVDLTLTAASTVSASIWPARPDQAASARRSR